MGYHLSRILLLLFGFFAWILFIVSCNKSEFLDKPPSSDLLIPETLEDFLALLENDEVMSETPVLGEVSADNYYLLSNYWENLKSREREAYTWQRDIYERDERGVGDWDKPYEQIFYTNVILNNLPKDTTSNKALRKYVAGAAYFIRAFALHNLAQVFCPAYDNNISAEDAPYGLPIPLEIDIHEHLKRETVKDTYNKIIDDLKKATELLPTEVPTGHLNRPSRPAAYALLARVYLSMRDYVKARLYADSCLSLYNKLIDYNEVNANTSFPFNKQNDETLYQSRLLSTTAVLKAIVVPSCVVDSNLYRSYDTNDLRRFIFYTSHPTYPSLKGSYHGSIFMFSGLATDEVYLIKAECLARTGDYTAGMNVLNTLLEKRWKTGTLTLPTVSNQEEALLTILQERRKELPFRGVRWGDLKRLNKEGFNITLIRIANRRFELAPNHPNYTLQIPPDVQNLNAKITLYPRI